MKKDQAEDLFKEAGFFANRLLARMYPEDPDHKPGFGLPWHKTAGVRFLPSEFSIWTGINGHGKSLFLGQTMLEASLMDQRVLVASLEMKPERTLERLVRQATGKRCEPAETCIALEWLDKYFWLNNFTGRLESRKLLEALRYHVEEHGIKQILIDSLMKIGFAQDDYTGMVDFADKLQGFCQKHDVHVHLVAHAKKQEDESDTPGKMDVKGPAELTNLPDNVFCVWRNKPKEQTLEEYRATGKLPRGTTIEDVHDKYDAIFTCAKSREHGSEAEKGYGLYFHHHSWQYLETRDEAPRQYIQV
jgi:twinkle protein